jgi:hypothetical protein
MSALPSLRVRIEAVGDGRFDAQLTAYKLANHLSRLGHEVSVHPVDPSETDPRLVAERRRQMRVVPLASGAVEADPCSLMRQVFRTDARRATQRRTTAN